MATLKVTNIKNESFAGDQLYLKTDGKIGIGTTDPDAPLTLHNSTDPEIRFGYSATQDHRIAWDSSKVHIHADPDNANGSSAIGLNVDGTTRLYINDSGNVGIGRTDPGHKLAILGGSNSQLEIKGTEADFWLTSTGGGSDKAWRILGSTGGSTHRFRIYDNANGREPFYIDNDGVSHFGGDVKVLTGDIQMGSGRGINFSPTSDAGGMASETFDDYEEGTWVPAILGGTSAGTYTYEMTRTNGKYTKIGNLVYIEGVCRINSITAAGSGSLNFSGLPFAFGSNIDTSWNPGRGIDVTHYGAGTNSSADDYPPPFKGVGSPSTSQFEIRSLGKNYSITSEITAITASNWIYQIAGFYQV